MNITNDDEYMEYERLLKYTDASVKAILYKEFETSSLAEVPTKKGIKGKKIYMTKWELLYAS